jgi:hypothetical protein
MADMGSVKEMLIIRARNLGPYSERTVFGA